ncbi:MAG: acetate/propionate family kinase, partial [Candidatus Margulisiibacteriota bacterium]
AFHHTLPEISFTYPIPYEWHEKYQVRRYGFHGTSHLYVSRRAARFLGLPTNQTNLIILHIGSGVSICAVREGISVDTSMGFTPLEGAMMGNRSGDIDPAIVSFMSDRLGFDAQQITSVLNTKSGHLGVTGQYSDRRDVVNAARSGDRRAQLSLDMEVYRLKKYIGAYLAVLGRVDAIVFTAGVGENSAIIRSNTLHGLEPFGIVLDEERNDMTQSSSGETLLSTPESAIKLLMIPTHEEVVLVEDVVALLEGYYQAHTQYVYQFEK